jgi:phospholipid transport system substrate-binding protein
MTRFRAVLRVLVLAAGIAGSSTQHAAAETDPISAPIASLDAGLLRAMHQGRGVPFQQRYQALAPIVTQAFDLQAVLATAVGIRWRDLQPDQQQALLTAFTRFTVSTYVANFDSFEGQRFDLTGTRALGDQRVVQTRLVPANGEATEIDYVMRQEQGGWRAVDVLLEGTISRAAVMRSDFRSLLGSGNAQALIQNLDQKSNDLANGTQH